MPRTPRRPGSVNPRDLPPGSPYACKDPYVGARVAVGDVAGRIVGCATPPEGKRGRYFAVGEIASGAAIGRAWKDKKSEALRAALRGWGARWETVDPGRFRMSGTDIPVVILTATRPTT
jgi:hypothetical protein